jgi:tRNA threonylcarbamoyladenosine biosynthesis protein TsaE
MRIESSSAAETEAAGAGVASQLGLGDVVVVRGEIGAGKTTLVRGAARALGVTSAVTSPTFTVGQLYEATGFQIAHLDLYRLATIEDEDPGLLDDYVTPERIAFVEWPDAALPELGRITAAVRIEHAGGDRRVIEIG